MFFNCAFKNDGISDINSSTKLQIVVLLKLLFFTIRKYDLYP
jgi:hypothetical protein